MTTIAIPRPRAATESTVSVPGDKSISHRALMCASIARGDTTIENLNGGADVMSTSLALRALGVPIETRDAGAVLVRGTEEFDDPRGSLDCGNSGSTMRMLSGLIAGRVNAVLDGDESLRRRPMERVATPLRAMGADIATGEGGGPPLTIRRVQGELRGVRLAMDVASAQVKTAVLLAGLRASGQTEIIERLPTRDHTERMLRAMGADIDLQPSRITLRPSNLRAVGSLIVPGDFSAAFFFIAGAAVRAGSRVVIKNVGVNPTRTAALDAVQRMGADMRLVNMREVCGEPVADIDVRGTAQLHVEPIAPEVVPNLIDEIPTLCALAALSSGEFIVRGAAELRTKESDRIETTIGLLRAFGAEVEAFADGLAVRGGRPLSAPATVDTKGDHRIGMAAAVLALGTDSPLGIDDADCVATSFPNFRTVWASAFC